MPWWEPRDCSPPLPGYTPREICSALAGRRLIIIGDSMSRSIYENIIRALAQGAKQSSLPLSCDQKFNGKFPEGCVGRTLNCSWRGGTGTVLLAHVRSDFLNFSRTSFAWSDDPNFRESPVHAVFARVMPTHVLLNRGAHFQPDKAYVRGWEGALDYIARVAPRARVLVRNTPAGHPGCGNATGPLSVPDTVAVWPFHWGDFPRQNSLLRNLTVRRAGLLYLDVATPTRLRPDMHWSGRDCLHYGYGPGNAVETWVRLLMGAMGGGGGGVVSLRPPKPRAS